MATIRAADGGYLLNSEQFNYTKDAQGRPVLNVVGGGGGTVTEADIENALGYKPIGAADVPVKSVNGHTGAVTLGKADVGLGNVDNVSINTRLNRMTNVNAADTNYTTYMARGEALFSAETTPSVNGAIAWQYE